MKNSRVIVRHSKECLLRNHKHPWSGLIDGHYWGNYAANADATRGNYHVWYRVTCNDPKCPAIKAVNSKVLSNA